MISQDRLEKALTFISTTDEKAAELKTDVERAAYKIKAMKAQIIAHEDGAMELRKAIAEKHERVAEATGAWLEYFKQYHALDNKRKTEILVIDVWRSLNASRRQGNIT